MEMEIYVSVDMEALSVFRSPKQSLQVITLD